MIQSDPTKRKLLSTTIFELPVYITHIWIKHYWLSTGSPIVTDHVSIWTSHFVADKLVLLLMKQNKAKNTSLFPPYN